MPLPSTGYSIPTIAALKAIAPTDRTDGYSRCCLSDPPAWYTYRSASTATGNDDDVVVPADNPAEGRWLKTGANNNGVANKILTSDTSWAVDPVNGNDANSGDLFAPFATLKKASFVASGYINPDGYTRTITLLPGTHNGAKLTGFINCGTDDYILIKGSTEGQSPPPIVSGVDCLSFAATGIYKLEFLKLVGTQTVDGNCLCINNARVKIGNEVEFGETTNNHIVGFNHATIEVLGDYQITGNAGVAHIFLDSFSFLDTSCLALPAGRQITLTPGIALSKFAILKRSSYLSAKDTSFNGSSSGQKFDVSSSSTIDTNTGDTTLFPGDTAGVLTTGGQYF